MISRIFRGRTALFAVAALAMPVLAQAQDRCTDHSQASRIAVDLARAIDMSRHRGRDGLERPLLYNCSGRERAECRRTRRGRSGNSDPTGEGAAPLASRGLRYLTWIDAAVRANRSGSPMARLIRSELDSVTNGSRGFSAGTRALVACYISAQYAKPGYQSSVVASAAEILASPSRGSVAAVDTGVDYSADSSSISAIYGRRRVPAEVSSSERESDRSYFDNLGISGLVLDVAGPTAASEADAEVRTAADDPTMGYGGGAPPRH
jgi:hypothetical protein